MCFTCELWLDGKRVAQARSLGDGSATIFDVDPGEKKNFKEMQVWAAGLPPTPMWELPMTLELWLNTQVCDHLLMQDFRSLMKAFKGVLREHGTVQWYKRAAAPKVVMGMRDKWLHNMPESEAFLAFKRFTEWHST